MPEGEDDALRAAATHRGLKLVKSRKRKPGVGDYGHFGLTDARGEELFGFGPDGLTALPADIRDYLRKTEVSTWAQSAEVTPDRPKPAKTAPVSRVAANDTEMPDEKHARASASEDRHRRKRAGGPEDNPKQVPPPSATKVARRLKEKPPPPAPEPEPEPILAIRQATKADLNAIKALVGLSVPAADFAARFNELKRAGGDVIVADRGGVVGCVAWQVILGLQEAPIGRLTLLIVSKNARRQGLGRTLVDAARSAIRDQDCATIEAMSDIELRNANGFYRALDFAQKSYRFVSDVEPGG